MRRRVPKLIERSRAGSRGRGEAATAPIDRGWERGDQRAGTCANPQVGDCAVSRGRSQIDPSEPFASNGEIDRSRPRLCENSKDRRQYINFSRFSPFSASTGSAKRKSSLQMRRFQTISEFSHSLDPKRSPVRLDNFGRCCFIAAIG